MSATTTSALMAREQLLALVMASHNRCGASSPARHFVSLPPLATSPLWDWCLRDTEVVLGVTTATRRFEVRSYFTLGISSALSGVTRRLTLRNTWAPPKLPGSEHSPLPDSSLLISKYTGDNGRVGSFFLVDIAKPTQPQQHRGRQLLTERYTVDHRDGGNHKWWVHSNGRSLAVANLLLLGDHCNGNENGAADAAAHHEGGDGDGATVVLSDVFADGNECTSISFSKKVPDEALLVLLEGSSPCRGLILMVVDINETYRRRNLSVLSLTKCEVPPSFKWFSSAVVMRKSNGERGIFVELCTGRDTNTAYEVKEGSLHEDAGSLRVLCRNTNQLSQLSGSLFCITKDESNEIWDCNNTTAPLRVLPARHSGCLSPGVDVTDSTTGSCVATFEFDTLWSQFRVNELHHQI
ncbi:hypothetical protein Pelo_4193 [Pelomyxa schiedti]|nr:hypothetical protein Pelo_4193 [Pelomyxa schiedti]